MQAKPKRGVWPLALAGALALAPAAAEAGVFELEAQVHTGGMTGFGFKGELKEQSFHDYASGYTYGVLVGVELLFVDAWVQHDQYYDGSVAGTFTQLMAGFDVQFDMGDPIGATTKEPDGAGYSRGYGEIGFGTGFGFATRSQVNPPLSDDELTDKAVLLELDLEFGYRFNRALSVGIHLPLQAGYYLVTTDDAVANDVDNQYGGVSASAVLTLRANVSL